MLSRPLPMKLPAFLIVTALQCGNLRAQDAPRWTAFHTPELKAALEPLAEHRRGQGYEVELIEVAPGENEAVAEKLRLRRESPRKGDVALIAGAMQPGPGYRAECVIPPGGGKVGRMAGRMADAALATGNDNSVLCLGRLPAGSPDDLSTMVAKILRFEATGEAANGKMIGVVGNPMAGKPVWPVDLLLALQTKSMLAEVNPAWRISGVADLRFQPFAGSGADFEEGLQATGSEGWEVMSYFGHSGPEGIWTGGRIHPLPHAWEAPQGAPRGLFFTCGCHAISRPDAYALRSIRAPGGPAAVIGASGVSYSTIGYLAGKGLLACMREKEGPATVGEWWTTIQSAIASEPMSPLTFALFDHIDGSSGQTSLEDQRKEHLEMWWLLGDPAMRMPR